MPDLGMPTLIEIPKLEDCAKLCSQLGLEFLELNMNMPQYQLDKLDNLSLARASEKYNIYFTIHLDENLNISDFNPYVAGAYRRTVLETIERAKQLHIPVLNMHLSPGVYFTLPGRKVFLFDEYKAQYLRSMELFRDECEKSIGESNIIICVENSGGYTPFHIQALDILLESEVFALTFDIGHNYCIKGADEPIILKYKDRLRHFHFHDAAGKKDHLALGEGELDLKRYLNMAELCGCRVVLETKTVEGLKKSAEWMKKNKS